MARESKAAALFTDIPAGPRAQYLAGWAKAAELLSSGKIPATHKIPAYILNYVRDGVPARIAADSTTGITRSTSTNTTGGTRSIPSGPGSGIGTCSDPTRYSSRSRRRRRRGN
jgi:hypothetical protein